MLGAGCWVLTVVGKPTGDDKSFLVKQQEQVDKLYEKIGKAKYGNTLVARDAEFVEELMSWKTLQKVLCLQQK